MQVHRNELSQKTFEFIVEYVKQKPDAFICFPGGNTPLGTYSLLVDYAKRGEIDFSSCSFIGLDEWVGMDRHDDGSCQETMYNTLFTPLNIKESNIYFFDAKSVDLEDECRRIDEVISSKGGIDLMLLGIGVNGHLGFNEPGVPFDLSAHVIELDDTTKVVGQKYFKEETTLSKGITLGIKQVLQSDTVILMANGENKATAVKAMVEGEVTNQMPASALQKHENCYVMLDEEAAAQLKK